MGLKFADVPNGLAPLPRCQLGCLFPEDPQLGGFKYTPQNKHGSPENGGPLEKEIPIGKPNRFQDPC